MLERLLMRVGKLAGRASIRFMAGYALVLLLPILVFAIVYNGYFLRLYRNDVLEQNTGLLRQQVQALDSHLQQMEAIVGQVSTQAAMRGANLKYGGVYREVSNVLSGLNHTHPFFDRIVYYNAATPYTVYTDMGTYNVRYFCRYRAGENLALLPEYLDGLTGSAWVLPESVTWSLYPEGTAWLQYVCPVPMDYDAYLIFFIPQDNIATLLAAPEANTFLLDGQLQLYPAEASGPSARALAEAYPLFEDDVSLRHVRDAFVLREQTAWGGLTCLRLISAERLLSKVTDTQRVFLAVLIGLSLGGGIIVFAISFHNYQPIYRLGEMAHSKVEVPADLRGLERARYALEKLDERYAQLDRRKRVEQALLRLIHGKGQGAEAELAGLGIRFQSPCLRAALIAYPNPRGDADLHGPLAGRCGSFHRDPEWILMEYPRPGAYLLIFGVADAGVERVQAFAEAAGPEGPFGLGAQVAVGGACRSLSKLCHSYTQALLVEQVGKGVTEPGLRLYEQLPATEAGFQYPTMELSSLYEAIISADMEKARLITEILTDIIHAQRGNNVVYTTLCLDTLNTYARGQEELQIQGDGLPEPLDYQLLCNLPDLESMLKLIFDIRDSTARRVDGGRKAGASLDLARQTMRYIDEHCREDSLCASSVADHFNLSISNLSHQFKAQSGLTLSDYISRRKLDYAKELLADAENRVSDVSAMLGYNQPTSFIRKFKQYFGMTPNEYRNALLDRERGAEM